MSKNNSTKWHINKQINISTIIQLIFLASLIVGSWVNLQKQLSLLQYDVNYLCKKQVSTELTINELDNKCIKFEYQIRSLEKKLSSMKIVKQNLEPLKNTCN